MKKKLKYCDVCKEQFTTSHNEDMCDDCLHENQDEDLGGTGHGDISHSDADPGL